MVGQQKILAIETSANICSVALFVSNQFFEEHSVGLKEQGATLLSAIDTVLKKGGVHLSEIDAIAVSSGPGSFVGLRLGMTVAQGLSFPFRIPLIAVSSLAVLAQTASRTYSASPSCIAVAVDAFMGEVYWGEYQKSECSLVQSLTPDRLLKPEEVVLPREPYLAVGSAWKAYPSLGDDAKISYQPQIDSGLLPNAIDLLSLARIKYETRDFVFHEKEGVVYLRTPEAWR